jgi:hypothetical protein
MKFHTDLDPEPLPPRYTNNILTKDVCSDRGDVLEELALAIPSSYLH